MESTKRLDLSHLATAEHPAEQQSLVLVYERGNGTVRRYDTDLFAAWRHEGDPYALLYTFEEYDAAGAAYFEVS